MAIINIMEKMVETRFTNHSKAMNFCTCELCADDVKCIALNKLPPKYVTSSKGELFFRTEQQMVRQNMMDIDIAVINAIESVKKRPRHD